jgi:hypothetical protein
VLGTIAPGDFDTGLTPDPPPVEQTSRRRRSLPAEDRPRLPRGALVSLRRSGGMIFRTGVVTVYRSGRVTYDADGPGAERAKAVWALSEEELAELRRELEAVDFAHLGSGGRASPDAYIYELVARVGRRVRRIELVEGGIPPEVEGLVRRLAAYAPPGG